MSRSRLIVLGVLLSAAAAAVWLARPEPIPSHLGPPPRPVPTATTNETSEPALTETEAEAEEAPRGNSLTRMALEAGLLKVRSRAVACRDEQSPPVVKLKISIAPTGAVVGVGLPPELKGSALGDCLVRAIRGASFPAWSAPEVPQVEWTYPLRFDAAE